MSFAREQREQISPRERGEVLWFESKAEYVETMDKELEKYNHGEPARTGVTGRDTLVEKDACEDVKIDMPESGLHAVFDGVSTANGWLAAREAGLITGERLGAKLDKAIAGIKQSGVDRDLAAVQGNINMWVMMEMKGAFLEIQAKLEQTITEVQSKEKGFLDYRDMATAGAVTKRVQMTDSEGRSVERMFYANLGDTRIYKLGKNGLERLTVDDTRGYDAMLREGATPEQLAVLDQLGNVSRMRKIAEADFDFSVDPHKFKKNFSSGSLATLSRALWAMPTRSGRSAGARDVEEMKVEFIDLLPGEKVLIDSDGIHDTKTDEEIAKIMMRDESATDIAHRLQEETHDIHSGGLSLLKDKSPEEQKQLMAEMQADGRWDRMRKGRRKPDDIAAVVFEVPKEDMEHAEILQVWPLKRDLALKPLREQLGTFERDHVSAKEAVQQRQVGAEKLQKAELLQHRLLGEVRLLEARIRESSLARRVAETKMEMLNLEMRPRFEVGKEVQLESQGYEKGVIEAYDPELAQYMVNGKFVDREDVELTHSFVPKKGDVIDGMEFVEQDSQGRALLRGKDDRGLRKEEYVTMRELLGRERRALMDFDDHRQVIVRERKREAEMVAKRDATQKRMEQAEEMSNRIRRNMGTT